MRVVVTGATGNVGHATIEALAAAPEITSVLGLARRRPAAAWRPAKTELSVADVTSDDLTRCFAGADAVVHLAWAIQPSHDEAARWTTNVIGSHRVFEAAAAAGVPALVHASSIGAYSPGPKEPVDEAWPTHGVPTSSYSRQKAYCERLLDELEWAHPDMRVVRMRPTLVLGHDVAAELTRLFFGRLVPTTLLGHRLVPLSPVTDRLRFQVVHGPDVGRAIAAAVTVVDARGPYNIAADPPLDGRALASLLHALPVPVPAGVLRRVVAVTWHLRLQPTDPGWLDLVLQSPLVDTSRARRDLSWVTTVGPFQVFETLLDGMRHGAGAPTAPLQS
jgi:UDP-glucose 4-epimerase